MDRNNGKAGKDIFWTEEFKKINALRLPFLLKQTDCAKKKLLKCMELSGCNLVSQLKSTPTFAEYSDENLLFSLVYTCLMRIVQDSIATILYSDSTIQKNTNQDPAISAFVPFTLQLSEKATFFEILAAVAVERNRLAAAVPCQQDWPLSMSKIKEKYSLLTTTISIQDTENFVLNDRCHLNIIINMNEKKIYLYLSEEADNKFLQLFVHTLENHLKVFGDLLVAFPAAAWTTYPWAYSDKQKQMLLQYSGSIVDNKQELHSLCALYRKTLANRPHEIALIDRGTSYTYAQLDNLSDKIADALLSQGVKAEEIVGVHLDKGVWLYAAIWGILKAGAAFFLVNLEFPILYRSKLLNRANIKVLISEEKHQKEIKQFIDIVYINIKNLPEDTPSFSKPNITLESLAYLVYTSGTTGDPKGALIRHEGIANTVVNFVKIFGITYADHILSVSALNFDAFMLEIMTAVAGEATLVFEDNENCVPGNQLNKTLHDNNIHVVILTPTALRMTPSTDLPHLKTILSAGEACHPDLYVKWSAVNSFINVYGPSETSAVVTYYKCHHTDQAYFPIGQPLPNVLIYILDKNMHPLPWGITGDIYIGGVAVAKSYLDPEQTRKSFIPNPFLKNGQLYKTGDIGRWLPDGNIEFLGRADTQIKIRGCRIELGEIENALHQVPGIANAIVDKETSGEHIIAYYIKEDKEASISVDEVKLFLLKSLPPYMLPHKYIEIDSIPLLPSGKVNRKALSAMQISEISHNVEVNLAIEEKLIKIWNEVFNRNDIDTHSDFFNLGGTSIHIFQVIFLAKRYNLPITFEDIYLNSTLHSLAIKISEKETIAVKECVTSQTFAEEERNYPLNPVQSGILFCYLHKKNINIYVVQTLLNIDIKLDIQKYKEAWQLLIQRHEILRTSYKWEKIESLVQVVHQNVILPFNYIDLRDLSLGSCEVEMATLIKEDKMSTFDLSKAPLIRIMLIQLKDESFQLVWTFHHIILDGYSCRILLDELTEIYAALIKKEKIALPNAGSFFDFYAQQNSNCPEAESFWKTYLQDANFFVKPDYFCSVGMGATETDLFLESKYEFQDKLKSKIQSFLAETKLSFTSFFQLAWALIAQSFSHTSEITFGFTITSRLTQQTGAENIVGPLINTVPIRISLTASDTIRKCLEKIQSNMFEIYRMGQHISLSDIRKNCEAGGKYGLFDTLLEVTDMDFYFDNANKKSLFNYSNFHDWVMVQYPLALLANMGSSFHIRVLYNAGQVKSAFVRNIPFYLTKIFHALIDNYNDNFESINILTDPESKLLFDKWQGPIKKIPEKTLISLFEEQVKINPEKIAVVFKDEKLTYSLLNKKANQLAAYITKQGKVVKSKVVVFLERSLESVISCLAILKAGGIYIPIDPQLPQARIQAMLEGLDISVIITNYHLGVKLKEKGILVHCIALDNEWVKIFRENNQDLNIYTSIDDPFCMIYTSGSTGKPKGVLLRQKTILNLFVWQTQVLDFSHISRMTQFVNLGFDVSLFEIFSGLLGGKEIHLVPSEVKRSMGHFINYIIKNKINQIFLPTALLSLFVEEAALRQIRFSCLHEIMVAGEALMITVAIKKFFILNNHTALLNCYGPTEGHIVTAYRLPKNPGIWQTSTPIGKPLPNVKIYLLDENRKPVPLGAKGELFIGGDILAAGYYALESLTHEKFLPDPFLNDDKAMMYRTGDIAEWDTTGTLLFHGRVDDQVKIQGYRVELSEIETLLLKHPAIKKCSVILHSQEQTKKIIAYVVLNSEMNVQHEEIQRYLSNLLPIYMLPAAYIFLDEFPLNKNGKVDKRMLPSPMDEHFARQCNYVPPRNEIEIVLSFIWSKILGVQNIGIHDDFFELGGNSLSAIQLQSNIYKYFLVDVSIDDLLNATTIADFSGIIKQIATDHYEKNNLMLIKYQNRHIPASIIKLQPEGTKPPLFLIHPIGGTAFGFIHLAKFMDKSRPCYAIQDPGIETGDALFDKLEQMAEFYVDTIIRIFPKGPYFLAGASLGATVVIAMLPIFKKRNKKVIFAGLFDGWAKYPEEIKKEQFVRNIVSTHLDKINFKEGDENSVQWIDLQLNRSQLLWNYKIPQISDQIVLFKAELLLPVFRTTDHPDNYWNEYCQKPVKVYLVPGDHEGMFERKNAAKLVSILNLAMSQAIKEANSINALEELEVLTH